MSDTSKLVKKSYLTHALANFYTVNENLIQNLNWTESKGSAAGDGFTTELVAVKGNAIVNGRIQNFSFMVKMTPENGIGNIMVNEMRLFNKECDFYGVILPLLEKERKLKGLDDLAIPKCFYAHPDPGVLVMNNLKDNSFDLLKQNSLGNGTSQEEQIIIFIKALASLHASTHHLIEQNGGKDSFLEAYPESHASPKMPDESAAVFKKALEDTIEDGIRMSKGQINENTENNLEKYKSIAWETRSEMALKNLGKYKSIAWQTVDDSYYYSIGDYQILSHGDCWLNNAMFRFEKGKAKEISLIDFQYTRITSPAVDVIYAIYTGTEPELRAQYLTKWLKIYHDQFSYELNVFGYDAEEIYPFSKFEKDFRDLFSVGLTWAFITAKSLKNKNGFDANTGKDDAYRQRLTALVNEAVRNNFV